MDLLSYLRFKAPGLILDYDSLDKDFFSKDKIVAARTVYAMNDVKLNCEYQRPRDKKDSERNFSYEYYHEHYQIIRGNFHLLTPFPWGVSRMILSVVRGLCWPWSADRLLFPLIFCRK